MTIKDKSLQILPQQITNIKFDEIFFQFSEHNNIDQYFFVLSRPFKYCHSCFFDPRLNS